MTTRHPRTLLLLLTAASACSDSTGPGQAMRLAFEVQPAPVGPGLGFAPSVVVAVEDAAGRLVTDWPEAVTISLEGGTGTGLLEGSASSTPEYGLTAFAGLTVSAPGKGYTLVARSTGLPDESSTSFGVPDVFRSEEVYAGEMHTCALDSDGMAWCWGLNDRGQLGDGSIQNRGVPTAVASTLRFASLSLGAKHTCGLTDAGAAYCWGASDRGQTGTGGTADVPTPHAVVLPGLTVMVAAGNAHTCALFQGGAAYCWGYNPGGLLGTGSADSIVATPEPVVGGLSFASLTAGYNASCGLTPPPGAAYCWGDNQFGTLGDSTQDNRTTPTPVAGGHVFQWIRTGGARLHSKTCGLAQDGKTYCWGRDGYSSSLPVAIPGDPGFESLVPGGRMTCGITAGKALYCWEGGVFGDGVGSNWVDSPVPVFADHGVVSVAVGLSYTRPDHVCAVTTEAETWCWGLNTAGQLGNPSNPAGWLIPVPVWAPEF